MSGATASSAGTDPGRLLAASRVALWATACNLLVVRLDNLGDVLMTTPALRMLTRPGRQITLLASPAGAAAAPLIPALDAVIVAEVPWHKAQPATEAGQDCVPARHLPAVLRCCRFDAAIIFTVCTQSALPAAVLCWQAGIPLRAAWCRENPYALLTDWLRDTESLPAVMHEVQRQATLVATLVGTALPVQPGPLQVRVDPADRARCGAALDLPARGRAPRLVVVHPGASAPARRYPSERYAALVQALVARGLRVLVCGSAAEQALCVQVAGDAAAGGVVDAEVLAPAAAPGLSSPGGRGAHGPVQVLAGRLTLGEYAAVLAAATLLVANNTGPVHLAAAVGTPVVDLYALTNPQHTPWQVAHRVLTHDVPCRHCLRSVCPHAVAGVSPCLAGVSVAAVLAAVLGLLARPEVAHA